MPDGWYCENCGEFHADVHVTTKITVEINPARYAAAVTVCSLKCFDACRRHFEDGEAYANEHHPKPAIVSRVFRKRVEP